MFCILIKIMVDIFNFTQSPYYHIYLLNSYDHTWCISEILFGFSNITDNKEGLM